MIIGDVDYPVAEAVLFFILIASLIFNVFLFKRGQGNYSIKYELMRKHQFFRANQCPLYTIQYIYKSFFVLPFLLIIAISVLRAINDINNLAPLLINGLIILLILYPTKNLHFNIKNFIMWLLALGSQLATLFLYLQKGETAYILLSIIFYSANIVFFFLSILSIQNCYWEISTAIQKFPQQVRQVNEEWIKSKENIPTVFDGGLYGYFCKNKSYKTYVILYFISLLFLGLYAFLVWFLTGSYLGITGLVTNIIYDIFIQIFNSLESSGRSLTSVYIILVAGRILTFIFGSNLWLLGYCILYFGVGVFIGWMIIDRHFPLQNETKKQQRINALRTPEFVLFILTLQIIIMILTQVYALKENATVIYNEVEIPIWQWGILALLAAWVVIIYMLSVRVLFRHKNRIHSLTQYYFGVKGFTSYHLYLILSYLLLIGLGLYAYLFLHDTVIFVCCIFLPLVYLCLLSWGVQWQKNQYQILAQTEDYNKKVKKQFNIKMKQRQILDRNEKLKEKKKQLMMTKFRRSSSIGGGGFFQSAVNKVDSLIQNNEKSGSQLNLRQESENNSKKDENEQNHKEQYLDQIPVFVPLKNWRDPDENIGCCQVWKHLTPSDKKIIFSSILLAVLLAGYCVTCMLWAKSQFGISLTVCLLSYLLNLAYYRCYKSKCQILIGQLIASWCGIALGFSYWGVYNYQVIGPVVYSFVYLVIAGFLAYKAFRHNLQLVIKVSLCIKIILLMVFILITLGIHRQPMFVAIFSMIFGISLILMVAVYYQAVHQHVPKKVIIIVSVLIGSILITMSVIGFVYNILSGFIIFTIIMGLIQVALLSASIALAIQKYNRKQEAPSVYSAYGYPHYRFESEKEQLKSNTNHMIIFSFSMVALIVYAVVVSIFFQTKQSAVYALSLFIIIDFFVMLRSSMASYHSLGSMKQDMTDELVLRSLKKLKGEYMIDETQGEDSPFYQKKLEEAKQEAQRTNQAKDWKSVVTYHDLLVKNQQEQQKFLFYWIVLIQFNLLAKRRQFIITTLNQLKEIQQQLNSNGIFLDSIDSTLKPQEKYEKVTKQIQSLQPLDHVIYEEILELHRQNEQQKKTVLEDIHHKEIQKNNERQEQLFNQIQDVPDPDLQVAKFQKLMKDLGRKTLFTDEDFPANQNSLGELQSKVYSWRRPNVGEMFSKSGISADDIKQGDIGDCYLVSSFGVLGEQRIKQAIGFDEKGVERWKNAKGAYMVRFYKFSKQYYVIIDDQLPINGEDEWVFAKSEDPIEFWPAILQKAYAKLYKGYHNIVEGKCHRVLAQFTGGFPFQIILQNYKSNPNGLWTQLISGKNNGYLLAAGSPSHPNGDQAFSKRGIVQGHAYSVLDVMQVDDYKLIKLKNPHGSAGKEWIGDFSDKSDLMTKRIMKILNHSQLNDGIFWMPVEDFIYEFKSLYICSVFDDRWTKIGPIDGQWTQNNSYGTPNNEECEKNPQYGITVTKKSTVFISLTQESKSALKGKYPIYMRVQRNNELRMKQQDISSQKTCGKPQRPIDAVTISSQIQLQADGYPYTFTLLICCRQPGSVGKYSLEIYCNDKQVKFIDDKDFDPIDR